MEISLALALSHATEIAAIEAAKVSGFGDKNIADQKATQAMRSYLNSVEFSGTVVIGEGERDQAPMLYIGEKLGTNPKSGPKIDIAVDPLENTNATADRGANAISVLAAGPKGSLLHAPDMYMEKLAVGPESADKVSLDFPVKRNLQILAKSLGRKVPDLTVVLLDRERNADLISQVRQAGARAKLVQDGDLMPGVATSLRGTGIHMQLGIGAAPEGVITAAALKCLGGYMQARFWPKNDQEKSRMKKMGVRPKHIYKKEELAKGGDILFAATGVTNGDVLRGVHLFGGGARTHSLVMSNQSGKIRHIDTTHVFDHKLISYHL